MSMVIPEVYDAADDHLRQFEEHAIPFRATRSCSAPPQRRFPITPMNGMSGGVLRNEARPGRDDWS
ncbi:MAG: hypothetical protein D6723_02105 [Acidobacteria bacterium]|nr:MAG: hypothetical protein D6723_02105 [Acidobacteriota bacterium]